MNKLQELIIEFLASTLDFEALDDIQRHPGLENLSVDEILDECNGLIKLGYVKTVPGRLVFALNIDVIKYE